MKKRFIQIGDVRSEQQRTVNAIISSDAPCKQGGQTEILSHEPEAIDLSRAPLPLLQSHKSDELPVGIVEDIQAKDGKLHAVLRFSRNATELWNDVADKVVRSLSVGYRVLKKTPIQGGYRADRWELLEVSVVAVPLDNNATILRNGGKKTMDKNDILRALKEKETETAELKRQLEELGEPESKLRIESGDDTEQFRDFEDYLTAVIQDDEPRLRAAGLAEGISTDGGYLVPEKFVSSPIMPNVEKAGIIAPLCNSISLNTSRVSIPTVNETSRATGSRFGGLRTYWKSEGSQLTDSQPEFGSITLQPHKLTCLVYLTDELMSDAAAVSKIVTSGIAEEIAFALDDAVIRGTGAGQPLGILNSGALITVDKETAQTADTIQLENIINMQTRLSPRSRKNSVWLINPEAETQLYSMSLTVGTGGGPCYLPGGSVSGKPYSSLFGRSVIPTEICSALGDLGDILAVDLSQYLIARRAAPKIATSMHVRFLYDEHAVRCTFRVDGMPIVSAPITQYKSSVTMSPFVCLAARD